MNGTQSRPASRAAKQALNLRIDPSLILAIKREALERGMTVSDLVTEAFRERGRPSDRETTLRRCWAELKQRVEEAIRTRDAGQAETANPDQG